MKEQERFNDSCIARRKALAIAVIAVVVIAFAGGYMVGSIVSKTGFLNRCHYEPPFSDQFTWTPNDLGHMAGGRWGLLQNDVITASSYGPICVEIRDAIGTQKAYSLYPGDVLSLAALATSESLKPPLTVTIYEAQ